MIESAKHSDRDLYMPQIANVVTLNYCQMLWKNDKAFANQNQYVKYRLVLIVAQTKSIEPAGTFPPALFKLFDSIPIGHQELPKWRTFIDCQAYPISFGYLSRQTLERLKNHAFERLCQCKVLALLKKNFLVCIYWTFITSQNNFTHTFTSQHKLNLLRQPNVGQSSQDWKMLLVIEVSSRSRQTRVADYYCYV